MKHLKIQQLQCMHIGPVDLTVDAGQCVSISGPSGTGKSILLKALIDLIPNTGHVSLNSDRREQMKASEWRRQVGLLPAESFWWCQHVGQHFPELSDDQKTWFTELGFTQDVLAWDISRCSTGERQRLALLRLLCHKPVALLLDEPTANLDATNTAKVETIVGAYRELHQCPVIWVSHDQPQTRCVATEYYSLEHDGQLQKVMA